MTINKGRWFRNILLFVAILGGAYWWLVLESSPPNTQGPAFDLPAARQLARSIAGAKPTEIRVEQVTNFNLPQAMIMAGESWRAVRSPDCAYQLVYPDRTVVIDTTMKAGNSGSDYDAAAFARVNKAMDEASLIVITHEHTDHIGGLAASPHLAELLKHTLLNREQMSHPEQMKPETWPAGIFNGYKPIAYQNGLLAVAPGVVLIQAPGHTAGSQMVFVERADGAEFLFIGDVAWQMRNIEQVKERPRLVTMLIGENRDQVMAELTALHAVMHDPRLHIVPGHDGAAIDELIHSKLLVAGFK